MRVTAIEIAASFDEVAANLERVDVLLGKAATDLALLPEASLTGYVSREGDFDLKCFAEPHDGPTATALAALAKKHQTRLIGPLIERAGDHVYNAMIGFDRDGREILHYRKRHPWYPEAWATAGSDAAPVIDVEGMRITIAICFDIHFGDFPKADLILFPSAWVEEDDSRHDIFPKLGMHVINANWGVGTPRVPGQGDSQILDASGKVLARASGVGRIDADLKT